MFPDELLLIQLEKSRVNSVLAEMSLTKRSNFPIF